MRFLGGLILGLGLAGQGAAQEQCVHSDLIGRMADYVIDAEPVRLARFGTRVAYYKMHYGGLAGEEIEGLFSRLDEIEARGADSLRDTYALSQPGGLAAWQTDVEGVEERFRMMHPSTLRALILADGGETYLELRAATLPDEDQPWPSYLHDAQPALYLTDQPDDVRLAIAQKAEAAGALHFAAALLAAHSDQALFDGILSRHSDVFDTGSLPAAWQFGRYSDTVRTRLLQDPKFENPLSEAMAAEYEVERAAALTHPVSFLYIYHLQSGTREGTYPAVDEVLSGVAQLDPLRDPEEVWVRTYRALLENTPPDQVRDVLRSFGWHELRLWTGGSNALEQLDIMVAKDLLGPFVRGDTAGLPGPPDVTTIDWDMWVDAARVVRDGGREPEDSRTAMIELLWEAGRYKDAWSIVALEPFGRQSAQTARDLASRLDMLCDQRSILPTLDRRLGRTFFIHFP